MADKAQDKIIALEIELYEYADLSAERVRQIELEIAAWLSFLED